MKLRSYYYCSSTGDDIPSSNPVSLEQDTAVDIANQILIEPRDFIGFIDRDGSALQFYYQESGKVWMEVPVPREKGSYGKLISLHEVESVIISLPETFNKDCLPDLHFEAWF